MLPNECEVSKNSENNDANDAIAQMLQPRSDTFCFAVKISFGSSRYVAFLKSSGGQIDSRTVCYRADADVRVHAEDKFSLNRWGDAVCEMTKARQRWRRIPTTKSGRPAEKAKRTRTVASWRGWEKVIGGEKGGGIYCDGTLSGRKTGGIQRGKRETTTALSARARALAGESIGAAWAVAWRDTAWLVSALLSLARCGGARPSEEQSEKCSRRETSHTLERRGRDRETTGQSRASAGARARPSRAEGRHREPLA